MQTIITLYRLGMPTLTVRDIPDRVYERLRERAGRNRRSMSGEIVTLLEESLLPQLIDTEALIAEAEAVHSRFPAPLPDLMAEGKRHGRRYEEDLAAYPRSNSDIDRETAGDPPDQ